MKKILDFFCAVLFLLLWVFIIFSFSIMKNEGILSVLKDSFGTVYCYILLLISLIIIASIIYLPRMIKVKWIGQLIAYIITIIFYLFILMSIHIGNIRFEEFSKEKWIQFPARRITMYDSLKKTYGIIGFSKDEVENLLGKPDKIAWDGNYIYDATYGNALYVEFKDEKSIDFYYVD